MAEEMPDDFTAPVCQALTTPMLWAGVPRNFGILNCVLTLAAVFGFHWYWYLGIGPPLHCIVKAITKYDPYWIEILVRSLRYHRYYEA